jgi:protein gp37
VGFDVVEKPHKLKEAEKIAPGTLVFVNSMSDLFHEEVPDWYVERVARVMQMANWHTYQVLTKRAGRLQQMLKTQLSFAAQLDHIWWGVSVEDKRYGVPRMAFLREAAAAVRFLSVEPLLEDLGDIDLAGINWVIVGGESGPGARPMQESWVIRIREQCRAAGIPFFFKQWGGVRKSANGRLLEGRTFDEMPQRVAHEVPSRQERLARIAETEKNLIGATTD